jgi:hypothetical protein
VGNGDGDVVGVGDMVWLDMGPGWGWGVLGDEVGLGWGVGGKWGWDVVGDGAWVGIGCGWGWAVIGDGAWLGDEVLVAGKGTRVCTFSSSSFSLIKRGQHLRSMD